MRLSLLFISFVLGTTVALPPAQAGPDLKVHVPVCKKANCLAAHDINGFELGDNAKAVVAEARKRGLKVEDVGGGQIQARDKTHDYTFLFTPLGRLSFIGYIQNFGKVAIDSRFYSDVARRIEAKYGIPTARNENGGLQGITYYQPCVQETGKRTLCPAEDLVVFAQGGHYPFSLELHITLADHRIDSADANRVNQPKRDQALDDMSF